MGCGNDQLRFWIMNALVTIIFLVMATSLSAESLSFLSLQIEIPAGWEPGIENGPGSDHGSIVSLHHPNGEASLKIMSYDTPIVVSEDRLRIMTNVDASMPLTWQKWGDYSGYQHDYLERDIFYRQWWLVNKRTIIFITYQCDPESEARDTEEVDKIVRSIKAKDS